MPRVPIYSASAAGALLAAVMVPLAVANADTGEVADDDGMRPAPQAACTSRCRDDTYGPNGNGWNVGVKNELSTGRTITYAPGASMNVYTADTYADPGNSANIKGVQSVLYGPANMHVTFSVKNDNSPWDERRTATIYLRDTFSDNANVWCESSSVTCQVVKSTKNQKIEVVISGR